MKKITFLLIPIFAILLWSFVPDESALFCELLELGPDQEFDLGDVVDLELLVGCPLEQIESIVWEPMTFITCDGPEFCLTPTVTPLTDICYEVTITSSDGIVGVDNICLFLDSCDPEFAVNNIRSVSPEQINDNAEIVLEMVQSQYTKISLIVGEEVLFEIWDGWVGAGDSSIDLDFSAVQQGSYQLRAQMYPEDLFIDIQKN